MSTVISTTGSSTVTCCVSTDTSVTPASTNAVLMLLANDVVSKVWRLVARSRTGGAGVGSTAVESGGAGAGVRSSGRLMTKVT